jgi:hypothetical protein
MVMCHRNMCTKAQRPLADLSECNNGCWKGRDSSVGLSDRSRDRPAVPTATATPPPCSHTLLPSHLFLFLWASLFALFGSFVTLSSQHPSRATLTHRLVASVGCVRSPPSLLHGALKFQALQALPILSHSFRMAPFTSNLGAPPGCFGGGAHFFPSCLVAFTIRLTCVVDHHWSTSLSMSVHQCTAYLSECVFFADFAMVYAVTLLSMSDLVGLATL